MFQPKGVKLNSQIGAYHPDLPFVNIEYSVDPFPIAILKYQHEWIILISIIYTLLTLRLIKNSNTRPFIFNIISESISKIRFTKVATISFIIFMIFSTAIFVRYDNDLGDPYIGLFITYLFLSVAYFILSASGVIETSWISDKYETSGLQFVDPTLLTKIQDTASQFSFYSNPKANVKQLASIIDVNPNYISQIINTELGQNFKEFLNQYRIAESLNRLDSPNFKHLSIEGIGYSVGFGSKSTFYQAFKKVMNQTPKAYKDKNNQ